MARRQLILDVSDELLGASWLPRLAADGVTVGAIPPGVVDSPMLAGLAGELGLTPADVDKRWRHDQLLVEESTPDEVSGALLWLLSDAHVTGHCVAVDGGALAR